MRAMGVRPDGGAWAVAVEAPDRGRRAPHSILALRDAAVATSGDCRHRVTVGGRALSHRMDPARGAPLPASPASVTVIAPTCALADAWATAPMVTGVDAGARLAQQAGLDALLPTRDDAGRVRSRAVGRLFSGAAAATARTVGD
jgi:thiamine biosynthesis lipoprotein